MNWVYSLLSRTADGALVTDGEGIVRYWNPPARRLLGFSSAEIVGQPCHEVMRGRTLKGRILCSPTCPVFGRLTQGKAVRNFDMQVTTKSGQVVWLNVSSIPVPSPRTERYVVAHLFHEIRTLAKIRQLTEELHGMVEGMAGKPLPRDQKEEATGDDGQHIEVSRSLPLTEREREILQHLAEGMETKRIADRLCISQVTVRNHIQHILGKLGAHSRLEALAIAFRPRAH